MAGLIIALAAALALCAALGVRLLMHAREAARLSAQIQEFLDGDMPYPAFSVRDSAFSQFENAVVELETRLNLSGELRREESERGAELIVDISHQLKTPLASLRLYCELDGAPHSAKSLELIDHMERMVRALLRLEKLRAGGYDMDFTPHRLDEIVASAAAPLIALFPGRRFSVSGQAGLRCDAHWLGECFSNLIKNACEHTRPGGAVSVSIEPGEASIICTVQDDGGGVPPDELPRLFRRFYRSSTSAQGGAGVGLAIAREIVQRHHGTISAENARCPGGGRGLKVTLCLPLLADSLKKT